MTAMLDTASMYNNFFPGLSCWLLRRRVVDAKVLPGTTYLHQPTTARLVFQVAALLELLPVGKVVFWVCLEVFIWVYEILR